MRWLTSRSRIQVITMTCMEVRGLPLWVNWWATTWRTQATWGTGVGWSLSWRILSTVRRWLQKGGCGIYSVAACKVPALNHILLCTSDIGKKFYSLVSTAFYFISTWQGCFNLSQYRSDALYATSSLPSAGGTTVVWQGGRQRPSCSQRVRMAVSSSVHLSTILATMSSLHGWKNVCHISSYAIKMESLMWEVALHLVVWHHWYGITRRTQWLRHHLGQCSTWSIRSIPPPFSLPTSSNVSLNCKNRTEMCLGRLAFWKSLRCVEWWYCIV